MKNSEYPCVICKKPLHETEGEVLSCSYCRRDEKSDLTCEDSHFVCESCRTCTPTEIILRTCMATSSDDPLFLANLLMYHPAIPMSGPEHHILVPAILLTVAHNVGYEMALESRLRQVVKRAAKFGLGSCASIGACGAAMGVPIAVSLLMRADYTKPRERKSVLNASAVAMTAAANLPAPRCCKASVYSSLTVGNAYLSQEMGLEIPTISRLSCQFRDYNPECVGPECPFFMQGLPQGDT